MFRHSIAYNIPFRSYLAVARVMRAWLIVFVLCYAQYLCEKILKNCDSSDIQLTSPYFRDIIVRGKKILTVAPYGTLSVVRV